MAQPSSALDDVRANVSGLSQRFPGQGYVLLSMGLYIGEPDHDMLYRDCVLDGSDDKKLDFVDLDRDSGVVYVAQSYESPSWDAVDPPSNKAADLNTALAWLLDAPLETIPREDVRAKAEELRDALALGEIHTIEVLFVHNCKKTANVDAELKTVDASLGNRLLGWAPNTPGPLSKSVRQLALSDTLSLYESRYSTIKVAEQLKLPLLSNGDSTSGPNWKATFGAMSGQVLVDLYNRFGDSLFSANIRDYLGSRSSSRNINKQISETARGDSKNFWVFNNGVSLITRRTEREGENLVCSGIAVVNGAQTIGSLHDASSYGSIGDVAVMVRVIESGDDDLIQRIIRFNNTQNPIKPWELRVLDPVQDKIRDSFQANFGLRYQFRRGVHRRAHDDVLCERLAPWLHAFYGDPYLAHRNSPELFENERIYRSLFHDSSDVRHLLFVYRLGEAIGSVKDELREAVTSGTASSSDAALYAFFRYGAFSYVALHLCAEVLAEVLGSGLAVKKRLALTRNLETDRDKAIAQLSKVVRFALAPVAPSLEGKDAYQELRGTTGIEALAGRVRVSVSQMRSVSPDVVNRLKDGIEILP